MNAATSRANANCAAGNDRDRPMTHREFVGKLSFTSAAANELSTPPENATKFSPSGVPNDVRTRASNASSCRDGDAGSRIAARMERYGVDVSTTKVLRRAGAPRRAPHARTQF